ncbi:MAG TPA: bifunctional DNA-formamidopyrimidine glycosylase/DNA-(apurinic or apyrimidinic site) lyase [Acidobacteriaceae bacterium]|nr:bifunctional DNA-formamidopyrimidine glycosylase/DNA-(apurinic or apyrimidinic site) lyase [Acidobacteriaceae bacterium]
MPELPEVETIARGVDKRVRGRRIVSVWTSSKPEPFKSAPEEMVEALKGSVIQKVHRVGKHIVIDLARTAEAAQWRGQWLVHLGMTGRLLVSHFDVAVPLHTHAIAQLDDQRELRFVDPRRFGRLQVLDLSQMPQPNKPSGGELAQAKRFTGSGQEPLTISRDAFRELFRLRRTPIKSALLNQSLLQGVGNIYADESLFRAGIRPRRYAARLTAREMADLWAALQGVLREAIALGGSSVSDYVGADGAKGFFQLEHKVYMRTGKPCTRCGTPIRRVVVAGRGTHYCPECQR